MFFSEIKKNHKRNMQFAESNDNDNNKLNLNKKILRNDIDEKILKSKRPRVGRKQRRKNCDVLFVDITRKINEDKTITLIFNDKSIQSQSIISSFEKILNSFQFYKEKEYLPNLLDFTHMLKKENGYLTLTLIPLHYQTLKTANHSYFLSQEAKLPPNLMPQYPFLFEMYTKMAEKQFAEINKHRMGCFTKVLRNWMLTANEFALTSIGYTNLKKKASVIGLSDSQIEVSCSFYKIFNVMFQHFNNQKAFDAFVSPNNIGAQIILNLLFFDDIDIFNKRIYFELNAVFNICDASKEETFNNSFKIRHQDLYENYEFLKNLDYDTDDCWMVPPMGIGDSYRIGEIKRLIYCFLCDHLVNIDSKMVILTCLGMTHLTKDRTLRSMDFGKSLNGVFSKRFKDMWNVFTTNNSNGSLIVPQKHLHTIYNALEKTHPISSSSHIEIFKERLENYKRFFSFVKYDQPSIQANSFFYRDEAWYFSVLYTFLIHLDNHIIGKLSCPFTIEPSKYHEENVQLPFILSTGKNQSEDQCIYVEDIYFLLN